MSRPATVDDLRAAAEAMPRVTVESADTDHPVYQVGGKSFIFFRTPRKDAIDAETGERMDDVIVLWTEGDTEKQAILAQGHPWFTTDHFNGHPSVLVRARDLGSLTVEEITEAV